MDPSIFCGPKRASPKNLEKLATRQRFSLLRSSRSIDLNSTGTFGSSLALDYHADPADDPPTGDLETSRLLHRALDQIKGDFAQRTSDAFWQSAIGR